MGEAIPILVRNHELNPFHPMYIPWVCVALLHNNFSAIKPRLSRMDGRVYTPPPLGDNSNPAPRAPGQFAEHLGDSHDGD